MTPGISRTRLLLIGWGVNSLVVVRLHSQPQMPAAQPPATNVTRAAVLKSPLDSFRQLLGMKPAEREKFLADRPAEVRRRILEKVQEYEAMAPGDREAQLRLTEARAYLLPMMKGGVTNRTAQLDAVPENIREIVHDRISQWDILPPDLKKEFLEFDSTMTYFAGRESNPATNVIASIMPPPLAEKLNKVGALPPEKRVQMYDRVQKFFDLNDQDQQKTIEALSDAERKQIEEALRVFANLPKSARATCLQASRKLAGMSEAERQEFLKNAHRWKELPAEEREAWRDLVHNVPPFPPGLDGPPMPPGAVSRAGVTSAVPRLAPAH